MPHRQLIGSSGPHPFLQINAFGTAPCEPMMRLASTSSASLFFGPSIPQTMTKTRSHTASNAAVSSKPRMNVHTLVSNRHSYAGTSGETIATLPWHSALNIPLPDSSPVSLPHGSHDDEDDMSFEPLEMASSPSNPPPYKGPSAPMTPSHAIQLFGSIPCAS